MSHNKIQVNSVDPDGSGNISITTDNVPETATNEYYTPARISSKIAATSINALADVTTAGATAGQTLILSGGVWSPGSATISVAADLRMIGDGSSTAYPWTGAAGTANEPYATGKQIEFRGLPAGTGLSSVKYDVRNAGTSDGTSAWTLTDAASYTVAGWVRAVSYLPAGSYLVEVGIGLIPPASTSYLEYQVYVNGLAHGSVSRIGNDDGYPRRNETVVSFASAPVAPTDNQIDVRVSGSSADLTGQGTAQAELGRLTILRLS